MNRLLPTLALMALCLAVSAHPPSGIAVDAQGRVFFVAGPMIVMVETNGAARTIVHDKTNEKFYQLHHIQRAPDGGLVTASDIGNGIWRFSPDRPLAYFYPPPNEMRALAVGVGGDPFAVDQEGNIYAVNSNQSRFTQILKIEPDGRITTVAGGVWGFKDGVGAVAQFEDPHSGSMIVSPGGALFLTDNQVRVRRIDADGRVTTLAGGAASGYADGMGARARFDGASGLAMDADGNLFVVEQTGRIRKITPTGEVSTFAGKSGRSAVDGPVSEAGFNNPTGIAIDPNGAFLILEPEEPAIRKIQQGQVTTLHRGLPN